MSATHSTFDFIQRNWLRYFQETLGKKCTAIRWMSPFIKKSAVVELISSSPPASIRILTRFNLGDCRDRVSDLEALRFLMQHGARIKGVRSLHSKLYVFEDRAAILGSANLTLAALRSNHELGVAVRDDHAIKKCGDYFDRMWRRAGAELTIAKIDAWVKEIEGARTTDKWRGKAAPLGDYGSKIDHESDPEMPPELSPPLERQVFVKIFGTANNRCSDQQTVLETITQDGSHWACTYPRGRRPGQPKDGDIVYFARMVDPQDYRIYGRGIAMKHVPKRDDASAEDIAERDWKKSWPHYIRVHDAQFIDATLKRVVSLEKMWNDLAAASYATTSANAIRGSGNTNPRSSMRRAASVRLAEQGAAWLAREFQECIDSHGAVSQSALEKLDWPESAIWLSKTGKNLLEFLVTRLEQGQIDVRDPASFPTYLDVAIGLGIATKAWPGLGKALRRSGLDDLDAWVRRYGLPVISGLIVSADDHRPGGTFFDIHGRKHGDEKWWRAEVRKSGSYPWRAIC